MNAPDHLREAIGNLVTHLDGRPRVECMEYRAFNCASPEVAYAGMGDGPYVLGFSPLGRTVWCIRIDGHDAIARLRTLQQELRPAVESADNDDSVRFIADELAYGIPFLPVTRDETVNRGPILHERDPDTGELRPLCEYVRADYPEALKAALLRLPAAPPDDLIAVAVVVNDYHVTEKTLQRARDDGRITGYRSTSAAPNAAFKYSRAEIARRYPQKS